MSDIVRAISTVVYDPSGKQKPGDTYPPGSVWMLDREAKGRRSNRKIAQKPTLKTNDLPPTK